MERLEFQPCENWRQFYLLWIKVALTTPLSLAAAIAFVLAILIPLVHKLFPSMKESQLTPLAWEIPLAIFCLIAAVRIVIAPYLIYRDRHFSAKRIEVELGKEVEDRDTRIHALTEKPKRSAAEQNRYDTVIKALALVKDKGKTALAFLRRNGSLTFSSPGNGINPVPPSGLTEHDLLWTYRHCASEGIVSLTRNRSANEETFSITVDMTKAVDDAIFPD